MVLFALHTDGGYDEVEFRGRIGGRDAGVCRGEYMLGEHCYRGETRANGRRRMGICASSRTLERFTGNRLVTRDGQRWVRSRSLTRGRDRLVVVVDRAIAYLHIVVLPCRTIPEIHFRERVRRGGSSLEVW